MINDMQFKIRLDSKDVSVYDFENYANENSKRKDIREAIIDFVDMVLNIEYNVDIETRGYGIKSINIYGGKVAGAAFITYYKGDSDLPETEDEEFDFSDFEIEFSKAPNNDYLNDQYISIYPIYAEIYFDKKKIEIQY